MGIYDCDYQLFMNTAGQTWNFYISDGSIFYDIDDNSETLKKVKLIDDIKFYDILLDEKNDIHLLCVNHQEELCYLTYSNQEWKKRILKKCNSNARIKTIHILNVNNEIHIFYTFVYSTNSKLCKVYHLHISGDKWNLNYLVTIILSKKMNCYFVDYNDKGEIFLFYNTFLQNRWTQQIKIYSSTSKKWSQSKNIKVNGNGTNITNFFIDSKNHLHLLYKYGSKTYWEAYDITILINYIKVTLINKSKILEYGMNVNYSLFEFNQRLWILWKISDHLFYVYSDKYESEWIMDEPLMVDSISKIKYIGNHYKEINVFKPFITYGISKNQVYHLLGMDDNFIDVYSGKSMQSSDNEASSDKDVTPPIAYETDQSPIEDEIIPCDDNEMENIESLIDNDLIDKIIQYEIDEGSEALENNNIESNVLNSPNSSVDKEFEEKENQLEIDNLIDEKNSGAKDKVLTILAEDDNNKNIDGISSSENSISDNVNDPLRKRSKRTNTLMDMFKLYFNKLKNFFIK